MMELRQARFARPLTVSYKMQVACMQVQTSENNFTYRKVPLRSRLDYHI
jgi:hypothetical protein